MTIDRVDTIIAWGFLIGGGLIAVPTVIMLVWSVWALLFEVLGVA